MVARDARLAQIVSGITRDFLGVAGYTQDSGGAMQDHSAMSESAKLETPADGRAARCSGARDRILLSMVLYAVVRTSQALAGDQAANHDAKAPPDARGERQPLPSALFSTDRSFADIDAFSATEFRPRNRSLAAAQSAAGARFGSDAPMLQDTTVWQQMMTDYKSQDRLRVLTLFETRGSTVSLQASKR